jgi:hypothetical protein
MDRRIQVKVSQASLDYLSANQKPCPRRGRISSAFVAGVASLPVFA